MEGGAVPGERPCARGVWQSSLEVTLEPGQEDRKGPCWVAHRPSCGDKESTTQHRQRSGLVGTQVTPAWWLGLVGTQHAPILLPSPPT